MIRVSCSSAGERLTGARDESEDIIDSACVECMRIKVFCNSSCECVRSVFVDVHGL
jgi:hypothetical protein